MLRCRLLLRGGRPQETARKASRRQLQIARLRATQRKEEAARERVGDAANATTVSSLDRSGRSVATRTELSTSGGEGMLLQANRPSPSGVVEANRTLQKVLLGSERESPLQREARRAIRQAASKSAAVENFLLLARSGTDGGGGVSQAALGDVAATLLRIQAQTVMGAKAYEVALRDAVGSSDDRWGDVSAEEAQAFARYQCTRLEAHAEKALAYSEAAGMTLEGADNDVVALVEYQLERYQREVAPVPTSVYADLLHMDISWNAALRLYDACRRNRGVEPPVEMVNRLMGLMTGYRSNGIGSRPWTKALELYGSVCASGYETNLTTHAAALAAVWRSGDTFHRTPSQRHLRVADQERMWGMIQQIRTNAERDGSGARLAGDEGCLYCESLVKAACAAGRVDVAIGVLDEMDTQPEDTSFRMLVPTAETFAFLMAACNAAGNSAHAEALWSSFTAHYTLRDLHSEALLVYLQSLRNVARSNAAIGARVETLIADGAGLDRPCAVACLQLLALRSVQTKARSKVDLARLLFDLFDNSVWLQEPLPRKVELQTVLRCCYLVSTQEEAPVEGDGAATGVRSLPLIRHVERALVAVFGPNSAEVEWLRDTEVYALDAVTDWQQAMGIFKRQVQRRPLERVKFLPVPVRQARAMTARALLRSCQMAAGRAGIVSGLPTAGGGGGMEGDDEAVDVGSFHFLDDEAQEDEKDKVHVLAQRCLRAVEEEVYVDCPTPATPCTITAELLLLQALSGPNAAERKELGVRATRRLALGCAADVTARLTGLVSTALGLTEEYAENVLLDGHAQLRDTALSAMNAEKLSGQRAVEKIYW